MKLDTFPVRQWGDMGDTEAPHLCLQKKWDSTSFTLSLLHYFLPLIFSSVVF